MKTFYFSKGKKQVAMFNWRVTVWAVKFTIHNDGNRFQ